MERGLKDGVALRLRHRVRWGRWVPRRMEDDALTSEDDGWCGLSAIDPRRAIGNSGGGVRRGLWGGEGDGVRRGEVGGGGVRWEGWRSGLSVCGESRTLDNRQWGFPYSFWPGIREDRKQSTIGGGCKLSTSHTRANSGAREWTW